MPLFRRGMSLEQMIRALRPFTDGSAQKEIAGALAKRGAELVREGFQQAKAPSGTPWKRLSPTDIRNHGPHPTLRYTGRLMETATRYRVDRNGFVFETVWYGVFHQSEAPRRRLPRRPFFPDVAGMPRRWDRALEDAGTVTINRILLR